MPRVEQEVLALPEQPSSAPVYSGVNVARSFIFCVVFGRSGKLHLYNRTTYTGVVEVAAKSTYSI